MPVDFNIELRLSYLKAAMAAQEEVEDQIQIARQFFDGQHYAETTTRQEQYLSQTVDSFGNLCQRVVNIPKDRLQVDTILPADDEAQAYADIATDWWNANRLNAKQKDIYQAALRDSAVALIVDWDPANKRPTFTPNLIYDGATGLVRFHYDSNNNLLFASKRWTVWNQINASDNGKRRLTIYRPDLIERYEADSGTAGGWRFLDPLEIGIANPQIWTDTGTAGGNALGIPVLPFENPNGSEISPDIVTIQEMINHNISTADITVDFHAWPVIWVAGVDLPVNSSTGNSTMPDFGPGQAIKLQADGSMGRLEPVDVQRVFEGVWAWVELLALIKGWPFFMFNRSGDIPSGIALQIAEGSLVNQVKDKQAVFGGAWADAFEMARKLAMLNGEKDLTGELKFGWASAKTADEQSQAETMAKKFEAAQYPLITRWRLMGHTQKEIEQFVQDRQQEDEFGLVDFTPAVEQ